MIAAGVAKKVINPDLAVPHAGWGAQTHVFANGIEADFFSTVLMLSDGKQDTLIIDLDTPMTSTEQTGVIRQAVSDATGIAVEAIRLSITHTHAGPVIWSNYYEEGKQAIADYLLQIQEQTIAAAIEARNQLRPARIGASIGACDIGKNRRQWIESGRTVVGYNPDGITDPAVGVFRVEAESGDVIANIVFYSCHPTMLGYTNQLHSPEYPGVMKRFVEQAIGGACLFMLSCSGNIGPGPEGFRNNVAAMRRIGTTLGAEAVKVSTSIEADLFEHSYDEVVESGASLALWTSRKREQAFDIEVIDVIVRLPIQLRLPLQEAKKAYDYYEQGLAKAMQNPDQPEFIHEFTYKVKRAMIALDMAQKYEGKTESEIEVQFIRLGDSVFIGVPLEPFVEIGMKIREQSPFSFTFFTGYTNGWNGYLPNAYDYPYGGYEVEHYPYAPEAAEHLIREVLQVLHSLKNGKEALQNAN